MEFFGIHERICICNKRFSADIPTDLSLEMKLKFFWQSATVSVIAPEKVSVWNEFG